MLIDRQRALDELGIPEEVYDELLQDFIAQTEPALAALLGAVGSQNLVDTAKTAHFVKGSAGNLRLDDLYLLAKEIESGAKGNQDTRILAENVSKLQAMFEELKKIILRNG